MNDLKPATKGKMNDIPLYNTRIIKTFEEYISKYHPQVDMIPILDYAGIKTYQLGDEGHWLTQRQVDRFYEILVKTVGDPAIARKVGQYTPFSKAAETVSQYTLGFITPVSAYTVLGKLYPHMSRGSTMQTRKVEPNRIEVIANQNPGVKEKPYQCENRLGVFEGITKLFTNKLATIEHHTCMHVTGGEQCIYLISWEATPAFIWKRVANYSFLFCLAVSRVLQGALFQAGAGAAFTELMMAPRGRRDQSHHGWCAGLLSGTGKGWFPHLRAAARRWLGSCLGPWRVQWRTAAASCQAQAYA